HEKLRVISHGLNLVSFENDNIETFEQYTLLNIGTLIRKKGVFQLVAIFNKLVEQFPQARLIFIGNDSPDVQSGNPSTWKMLQEQFTEAAKERTTYLGKIPYEHVQEHIKNAHVCVFPSLAETLGMVTIESMALGKSVVNTNLGWAQDLIVHGVDGYMYHPDDIDAYVETITTLFKDLEEVKRIAQNAQKSSRGKFDIKLLAQQNVDYYQSLLDS
ncbi:MAG: glycosyltransferase family 4 protein, partial [Nonlabens sp.]|nr:glycosyltransferase family 4 protein [Nonlabens sp.]